MNIKTNKTTCFSAHKSCQKSCINNKCRYWHEMDTHNNCIINMVNENEDLTLEKVGELFNVTRMRICQIEKNIIDKLKNFNQAYLD
jgi:DNA-directed RNA polymerase specialized sigma subunit